MRVHIQPHQFVITVQLFPCKLVFAVNPAPVGAAFVPPLMRIVPPVAVVVAVSNATSKSFTASSVKSLLLAWNVNAMSGTPKPEAMPVRELS